MPEDKHKWLKNYYFVDWNSKWNFNVVRIQIQQPSHFTHHGNGNITVSRSDIAIAFSTKFVGDSMCLLFKMRIIIILDNKVTRKMRGVMYLKKKWIEIYIKRRLCRKVFVHEKNKYALNDRCQIRKCQMSIWIHLKM